MSSVLHPVGPEPRERYWVRRLAVLVAIVVAVGIVVALVGNAMSAGSAVQAEPAPPTYVPPVVTPSPTPVATATPTASLSPSATPSTSPTPTSSSTAKGTTSTPTPTPAAGDKAAKAKAKAKADAEAKAKADAEAKAKAKAKRVPAAPSPCVAAELRPTLTGDPKVQVGKKTTFALSLINGSTKTCTIAVQPSSATLTIVSGSDRIWGTNDCPSAQPTSKRTVRPEHALNWQVTWSGERSGPGCSTSQAAPKKGYYWAIADFDGADEVRFRVILT